MSLRARYDAWLYEFVKTRFYLFERIGFHATPNHFYEPIPDTRTLTDELWERQSTLAGIDMREEAQLAWLDAMRTRFKAEYDRLPRAATPIAHQYYVDNGMFESVDGEVLYCMIRSLAPRRILEVGSGNSTYLSAQAVLENEADGLPACELTALEPYPSGVLLQGFPGLSRVLRMRVQEAPLAEFERLEAGDVLFIDSSHVLKIGGDVQYLYLEVLPRLRPGVVVQIHDIFLPSEYPKAWVKQASRFWTEQYVLQAFLAFNDRFEVLWGGSYMHLRHPEALAAAFASYDPQRRWPGSFWIRRTR